MIVKNSDGTISFDSTDDYQFISFFDKIVTEYCKNNPELRKKLIENFLKSFEVEK